MPKLGQGLDGAKISRRRYFRHSSRRSGPPSSRWKESPRFKSRPIFYDVGGRSSSDFFFVGGFGFDDVRFFCFRLDVIAIFLNIGEMISFKLFSFLLNIECFLGQLLKQLLAAARFDYSASVVSLRARSVSVLF